MFVGQIIVSDIYFRQSSSSWPKYLVFLLKEAVLHGNGTNGRGTQSQELVNERAARHVFVVEATSYRFQPPQDNSKPDWN